jgi:hypothetical protein
MGLSAQKDWSFHYWKKFIEKDYGTGEVLEV